MLLVIVSRVRFPNVNTPAIPNSTLSKTEDACVHAIVLFMLHPSFNLLSRELT